MYVFMRSLFRACLDEGYLTHQEQWVEPFHQSWPGIKRMTGEDAQDSEADSGSVDWEAEQDQRKGCRDSRKWDREGNSTFMAHGWAPPWP